MRTCIALCVAISLAATPIAGAQEGGDVVDSRPIHTFIDDTPLDRSEASWFEYRTQTTEGQDTTATASLFRSTVPWHGSSERPVVIITPFTQGGGDVCAFSTTITGGTHVDPRRPSDSSIAALYHSIHTMLEQGWDVIVPDHPGLGTPDPHSYMDNTASGKALLDAARAGLSLLDRRNAPIALTGHSQGAGASAWAAEHAANYAPDLNIVAAAISAPPYNLEHLARDVDGQKEVGMLLMAINTLKRKHPAIEAEFNRILTPEGARLVALADEGCVPAMFGAVGTRHVRDLTTTEESLVEIIERMPEIQDEIKRQELGRTAPGFPVLLTYHQSDHLVSWEDSHALGQAWRDHGGDVRFNAYPRNPLSDALKSAHSETAFTPIPETVAFLKQAFGG